MHRAANGSVVFRFVCQRERELRMIGIELAGQRCVEQEEQKLPERRPTNRIEYFIVHSVCVAEVFEPVRVPRLIGCERVQSSRGLLSFVDGEISVLLAVVREQHRDVELIHVPCQTTLDHRGVEELAEFMPSVETDRVEDERRSSGQEQFVRGRDSHFS